MGILYSNEIEWPKTKNVNINLTNNTDRKLRQNWALAVCIWHRKREPERKADCKPGGGIQVRAAAGAEIRGGDRRGNSTVWGSEREAAPGASACSSSWVSPTSLEGVFHHHLGRTSRTYTTRMSCAAPSSMTHHHTHLLQNFPESRFNEQFSICYNRKLWSRTTYFQTLADHFDTDHEPYT